MIRLQAETWRRLSGTTRISGQRQFHFGFLSSSSSSGKTKTMTTTTTTTNLFQQQWQQRSWKEPRMQDTLRAAGFHVTSRMERYPYGDDDDGDDDFPYHGFSRDSRRQGSMFRDDDDDDYKEDRKKKQQVRPQQQQRRNQNHTRYSKNEDRSGGGGGGGSSSSSSSNIGSGFARIKPWNDTKRSVEERVMSLVQESTAIHPADLMRPADAATGGNQRKASNLQLLIRQCCQMQTLTGLHYAHEVLDRLLVEKQKRQDEHKQQNQNATAKFQHHEEQSRGVARIIVPIALWEEVLEGWARFLFKCSSGSGGTGGSGTASGGLQEQATQRLHQVFQQALEEATKDDAHEWHKSYQGGTQFKSSRPTTRLCNWYLEGIAAASTTKSPSSALYDSVSQVMHFVTHQMHQWHQQNGWKTLPDDKTYMAAIKALFRQAQAAVYHPHDYYNSNNTAAGMAALDLLQQANHWGSMILTAEKNNNASKANVQTFPDKTFYSLCLQTLRHSHGGGGGHDDLAPLWYVFQQALDRRQCDGRLASQMIQILGTRRVNAAGNNDKQAAEAAQACLEYVLQHWDSQEVATASSKDADNVREEQEAVGYAGVIITDQDRLEAINACLFVWANTDSATAVETCEALIQQMSTRPEKLGGNAVAVVPDATSFQALMLAWSKQHKDNDSAVLVAQKMCDFLLRAVRELHIPMTAPSFTAAILTLAPLASGDATVLIKARELLLEWTEHAKTFPPAPANNYRGSSEHNWIAPFAAVLKVISEMPPSIRYQKSQQQQQQQPQNNNNNELVVGEDTSSSYDQGNNGSIDLDPYEAALEIWEAVRKDSFHLNHAVGVEKLQPNHHFYSAFLSCLERHLHPQSAEFQNMLSQVWSEACEGGQVSRLVWSRIRTLDARVCNGSLLHPENLSDDNNNKNLSEIQWPRQLPRYWTRNVPPQYM